MTSIPEKAVEAGAIAARTVRVGAPRRWERVAQKVLEAAAPFLLEAEREARENAEAVLAADPTDRFNATYAVAQQYKREIEVAEARLAELEAKQLTEVEIERISHVLEAVLRGHSVTAHGSAPWIESGLAKIRARAEEAEGV